MELNIRPMESKDILFVNTVRNACREYLHDPRSFSTQETIEWFVLQKPEWYMLSSSDMRIGGSLGYFRTSPIGPGGEQLDIGMDLAPEFQGRGLAVPAYKAFFKYIQENRPERMLTLEVLGHNIRAFNLYKKLGFEQYSYSEVEREGRLYPSIHMSLELDELDEFEDEQ